MLLVIISRANVHSIWFEGMVFAVRFIIFFVLGFLFCVGFPRNLWRARRLVTDNSFAHARVLVPVDTRWLLL